MRQRLRQALSSVGCRPGVLAYCHTVAPRCSGDAHESRHAANELILQGYWQLEFAAALPKTDTTIECLGVPEHMANETEAKMAEGRQKLEEAFQARQPTLQLGGLAATDPRLARAATDAGVSVLEPNHTAICCARALRGLTSMRSAYLCKHELDFDAVLEVVAAVRRAVPEHVFILSAAPGTFDESEPVFTGSQAQSLSVVGADGLFVEKNSYSEIERLVALAHGAGLLVQAGFQLCADRVNSSVIPVDSAAEVPQAVKRLGDIGVDILSMRLSGIFKGQASDAVSEEETECLRVLAEETRCPTAVYAGVSMRNFRSLARSGVKMVGIATAVDDLLYETLASTIAVLEIAAG